MEYTGIGKEKEEFVPRKSKEEFFRDGEVIEELYRKTERLMFNYRPSAVLDVFNNAYMLCWSHLSQKSYILKFRNMEKKNVSYAVAFVLLQLHRRFYTISDDSISSMKLNADYSTFRKYQSFAQNNALSFPVNFRAPLPEPKPETGIDFGRSKNDIMEALDEAIKLKHENDDLRFSLLAQEAMREEYERKSKALQEKLDAWENNAFYKAVNINTIFEYAQSGRCSPNNREAIRNTLLYLCSNKVSDEVIEKIRNLELGGNVTIQNNDKCQQFFGTITNSDFHKYEENQ